MWTYTQTNELYHYGVPGMKWGVRRAIKKQAKADYKVAKRAAQEKYKQDITKIKPDPNSEQAQRGKKIARRVLFGVGATAVVAFQTARFNKNLKRDTGVGLTDWIRLAIGTRGL